MLEPDMSAERGQYFFNHGDFHGRIETLNGNVTVVQVSVRGEAGRFDIVDTSLKDGNRDINELVTLISGMSEWMQQKGMDVG